ncbi:MAG TPA: SGNH/GDSL hydrolase family protein [Polyangiaceae bacterium]|jgi:hypothetical protein
MRKAIGRVGLAAASVVLALAFGECGVRAAGIAPTRYHRPHHVENADKSAAVDAYPTDPRHYFDVDLRDATTRARLGALGLDVVKVSRWTPHAVEFHYNAHRCRDRDMAPNPAPGVTRILMLGDSFTEGQGVREDDTFSRRLERELRAAGRDVEVLDCGRRGRDFPALWDAFEELVDAYHPNVVVYAMVLNDAVQSDAFRARQEFLNDWILDRRRMLGDDDPGGDVPGPRLWALFRDRMESRRVARATTRWYLDMYGTENADGWTATQGYIAKMRERMEGRFLVALLPLLVKGNPYPFAAPAAEIRRACGASNVSFVDLESAVAGVDPETLWVHAVDMHPNERAHALFAESLRDPVLSKL